MTQLAEERSAQIANFRQMSQRNSPAGPSWLKELRDSAMRRFDEVGFPNNKQEDFRHTNFQPIARTKFQPGQRVQTDAAKDFSFGDEATCELVFINGHYSPGLSRMQSLP